MDESAADNCVDVAGSVTCYRCRRTGHMMKDCVQKRDWKTLRCFICQRMGHIARFCTQSQRGIENQENMHGLHMIGEQEGM